MTRVDADDELAAVRERAEAIRAEQVERALSRLAARGEVTPRRRAVVERLADRLVDRLLAVPEATVRTAGERGDTERDATDGRAPDPTAEAVLALFRD